MKTHSTIGSWPLRETLRLVLLLLAALAVVLALGCSSEPAGPQLIAVDGVVTLDGRPLSGAVLTFIPLGDTRGQGAVARSDAEGRFHLETPQGRRGAAAGLYRVVISKLVLPDGSEVPALSAISPMDLNARQVLPDRYSSFEQATLTASVAPAAEPLGFALTTDKK